MNIAILTKEFPPHVYGGAGVHVEYLSRELRRIEPGRHKIHLLCFGDQKESAIDWEVTGIEAPAAFDCYDPRHRSFLDALFRDIAMVTRLKEADVIHCHTWYTHLAGCLLKQILDAPLVLTTHSLEPQRPWKREQLDTAYRASSWIEETAYRNADGIIAVSEVMRKDVNRLYGVGASRITVIHNGIDEDQYRPSNNPAILETYGIDPDRPFVLLVARLTQQKGIRHFLEAVKHLVSGVQIVICASAPDTDEIMEETVERVAMARRETSNAVIWVKETVPVKDLIILYSAAAVFVCPSIYEPFGIVNLEAMACGAPVVASAVGGIPEIVLDGVTGMLIPFQSSGRNNPQPKDPEAFARDLAAAVNGLLDSPLKRKEMGMRARERVKGFFSWKAVARRTLEFYTSLRQGEH